MNIQLISDLHLNHSGVRIEVKDCDVLVLAGDMSPYPEETAQWIWRNVPADMTTIYVPGNHEYENSNVLTFDNEMRSALADLKNVHFLQNEVLEKDGVRFLGTTLWTDFAAYPEFGEVEDIRRHASKNICDFQVSYGRNGLFTPAEASELHSRAKDFLKRTINEPFDGKTVVVSHFLPSPKCVSAKYMGSYLNAYFACNVEHLMNGVDVWMHGHTHDSVKIKINNTHVLCNPRGYSSTFDLSENHKWDPDFKIDLTKLSAAKKIKV